MVKAAFQTNEEGLPWWSSGKDSKFPKQGAQVRSLVRELDPACMPQLKIPCAATKTWCRQINLKKKKRKLVGKVVSKWYKTAGCTFGKTQIPILQETKKRIPGGLKI